MGVASRILDRHVYVREIKTCQMSHHNQRMPKPISCLLFSPENTQVDIIQQSSLITLRWTNQPIHPCSGPKCWWWFPYHKLFVCFGKNIQIKYLTEDFPLNTLQMYTLVPSYFHIYHRTRHDLSKKFQWNILLRITILWILYKCTLKVLIISQSIT